MFQLNTHAQCITRCNINYNQLWQMEELIFIRKIEVLVEPHLLNVYRNFNLRMFQYNFTL